jgi:hypothetical protein
MSAHDCNTQSAADGKSNTVLERRRAREALLTEEYVSSILAYEPSTGVFTWRVRTDASPQWNGRWAGKRARYLTNWGYRIIGINERDYLEHRIAFLLVTGTWPIEEVDHKEPGVHADNKWSNLRPASHSENNANRRANSNTASGRKGVSRHQGKWQARIQVNGQQHYLGDFTDLDQAAVAYAKAARELFGEFARVT